MKKFALACFALSLLISCSSSPKSKGSGEMQPTTKHPAKQAEYATGRTALQQMYISARGWAGDARLFRLQSQFTAGAPTHEGKAGLWRASFASPARRAMKMFVWSGLVGPDAPEQGITFSAEDSWSPSNASTQTFDIGFLKVDSDKAFDVAQKHGGEKLTAEDPKQPIFFVLDWDTQRNELVWHVIYGNSRDEARLRIAVNAGSGEFLRVEK